MARGTLFVFSGPSGSGKGTILSKVLEQNSNLSFSVSATTRKMREGEVDGVNYYYLSVEEFEAKIESGEMLEYVKYCDNYYGTPLGAVESLLESGKDVILEIEVVGAVNVMEKCPDAVSIFVLPPSVKELRRRLNKRGTETQDVIESRVNVAKTEILVAEKYDYIIINGELEAAIDDVNTIIKSQKHKNENAKNLINEVLENA